MSNDISALWQVVPHGLRNLPTLLSYVWPYVPVGAAFAVFLYVNGGIVVGEWSVEKTNKKRSAKLFSIWISLL